MGLAVVAFFAIFVLIGSAGLLLFNRSGVSRRLASAISTTVWAEDKILRPRTVDRASTSIRAIVQPFEKILPKNEKEVSIVQKRLIRAGYREPSNVRLFYGAKVLLPLLLCVIAAVTGASSFSGPFIYVAALGLGFLVPDFWLGKRITARQLKVRLGLPELLDLLVVCIEAGLGLDQALARAAEELGVSQPTIADELNLLILEQRAGQPRAEAWRRLAERVDIDVIRALVSAIIQADQFGTSIAKTLRVHSDTLRVQRRQRVEEQAAKTTVKLVFPLVLFIFPSLFVVTLGPAMITMSQTFKTLFK